MELHDQAAPAVKIVAVIARGILSPELTMAVSIPVVAALVWLGLRGLRKRVVLEDD